MVFLNRDSAPPPAARRQQRTVTRLASPGGFGRRWGRLPTARQRLRAGDAPLAESEPGGALVGAAAGSLVLGTVWAFLAKAKYDHALTTECGGGTHSCSPQGIADGHTAHNQALVATVGFVGAAVFLAGAAGVYFVWPTRQERIAVARVTGNGAGVALSW